MKNAGILSYFMAFSVRYGGFFGFIIAVAVPGVTRFIVKLGFRLVFVNRLDRLFENRTQIARIFSH